MHIFRHKAHFHSEPFKLDDKFDDITIWFGIELQFIAISLDRAQNTNTASVLLLKPMDSVTHKTMLIHNMWTVKENARRKTLKIANALNGVVGGGVDSFKYSDV